MDESKQTSTLHSQAIETSERTSDGDGGARVNYTHILTLCVNIVTFGLLVFLIATGAYVHTSKIIVGGESSQGYSAINVDTTYWNIGCNLFGTFVGIIAIIALSMQDDMLTRRELATEQGSRAIFLRPLTIRRGFEQLTSLQLPFERSVLLFTTIIAALTSATTIALLGVHSTTDIVVNPAASYTLAGLNGSFFFNGIEGGVYPATSPVYATVTSQLSGFAYKAAYIAGLRQEDKYNAVQYLSDTPAIPEQGLIGNNQYGSLQSGGIGLNTTSYMQYNGIPNGFRMPATYEFHSLVGQAYGTNITVSCENVTSQYTYDDPFFPDFTNVKLSWIAKPGGPNFTFATSFDNPRLNLDARFSTDGSQILTIAVGQSYSFAPPIVMDCRYSGREYFATISLPSSSSSLQILSVAGQGPVIGSSVQTLLQRSAARLVASGIIAQGLADAQYNYDGTNNTGMPDVLSTVLSNVGEAQVALMRQSVEQPNISGPNGDAAGELRLSLTIQRLGGGQIGWLAVLIALLVGPSMAIVRLCMKRNCADIDAQDAVGLLRKSLKDEQIGPLSRFSYHSELRMLGR